MIQEMERTTAGGQSMTQYWKEAWQKAKGRELESNCIISKQLVEINSLKEQRNRAQKEANNLKKKLEVNAVDKRTGEVTKL